MYPMSIKFGGDDLFMSERQFQGWNLIPSMFGGKCRSFQPVNPGLFGLRPLVHPYWRQHVRSDDSKRRRQKSHGGMWVRSVDMSGFEPEAIDVKASNGIVTVRASSELKERNGVRYSEFTQHFTLPKGVCEDKVKCFMRDDGKLTLKAPVGNELECRGHLSLEEERSTQKIDGNEHANIVTKMEENRLDSSGATLHQTNSIGLSRTPDAAATDAKVKTGNVEIEDLGDDSSEADTVELNNDRENDFDNHAEGTSDAETAEGHVEASDAGDHDVIVNVSENDKLNPVMVTEITSETKDKATPKAASTLEVADDIESNTDTTEYKVTEPGDVSEEATENGHTDPEITVSLSKIPESRETMQDFFNVLKNTKFLSGHTKITLKFEDEQ